MLLVTEDEFLVRVTKNYSNDSLFFCLYLHRFFLTETVRNKINLNRTTLHSLGLVIFGSSFYFFGRKSYLESNYCFCFIRDKLGGLK